MKIYVRSNGNGLSKKEKRELREALRQDAAARRQGPMYPYIVLGTALDKALQQLGYVTYKTRWDDETDPDAKFYVKFIVNDEGDYVDLESDLDTVLDLARSEDSTKAKDVRKMTKWIIDNLR